MSSGRHLEDFEVGQIFHSGARKVDATRLKEFAREFDPQPFHLDEASGRTSLFGGLVASGWHTAALTMSLLVESDLTPAGGVVGLGVDEIRWPHPVRPGDELQLEAAILEVRPSRSDPANGIVKVRMTTCNQRREPVQVAVANLLVPRRAS